MPLNPENTGDLTRNKKIKDLPKEMNPGKVVTDEFQDELHAAGLLFLVRDFNTIVDKFNTQIAEGYGESKADYIAAGLNAQSSYVQAAFLKLATPEMLETRKKLMELYPALDTIFNNINSWVTSKNNRVKADASSVDDDLMKAFSKNGKPSFEYAGKVDDTHSQLDKALAREFGQNGRPDTPPPDIEPWECRIGASRFYVPPVDINVSQGFKLSSMGSAGIRQKTSPKFNTGHSETLINMTLYFPNQDQIWGIGASDFANIDFANDSDEVVDNFASSLRGLITQFKYAPFLPIQNDYINKTYNVTGVAMRSLTLSTVEDFPFAIVAQIQMAGFNHKTFLPGIENFSQAIHWGRYRNYIGRASEKIAAEMYAGFLKLDSNVPGTIDKAEEDNGITTQDVIGFDGEKFRGFDRQLEIEDGKEFALYYPEKSPLKTFVPDITSFRSQGEDDLSLKQASFWDSFVTTFGIDVSTDKWAAYETLESSSELVGSDLTNGEFAWIDVQRFLQDSLDTLSKSEVDDKIQQEQEKYRKKNGGNISDAVKDDIQQKIYSGWVQLLYKNWKNTPYMKRYYRTIERMKQSQIFNEWDIPMKKFGVDPTKVIVNAVNVSLQNVFVPHQVQMQEGPTYQHLGSGDAQVDMSLTVIGSEGVAALRTLFDHVNGLARLEYAHGVVGFLGIKNILSALCGIKYVMPVNFSVETIQGYPNTFSVSLTFVEFDIFQQRREELSSEQQIQLIDNFSKRNPFLRLKQMWGATNCYPDMPLAVRDEKGKVVGHLDPDYYFKAFETIDDSTLHLTSMADWQAGASDREEMLKNTKVTDEPMAQVSRVVGGPVAAYVFENGQPVIGEDNQYIIDTDHVWIPVVYTYPDGSQLRYDAPDPEFVRWERAKNGGDAAKETYVVVKDFKRPSVQKYYLYDYGGKQDGVSTPNDYEENPQEFSSGEDYSWAGGNNIYGDLSQYDIQTYFPLKVGDNNGPTTLVQSPRGVLMGHVDSKTGQFIPEDEKAAFGGGVIFGEEKAGGSIPEVPAVPNNTPWNDYNSPYDKEASNIYQQYEFMLQDSKYRSKSGRMVRAFPTYMLWLIDEGGNFAGYKLFDNIYSLSSIIDFSTHQSEDILGDTLTFSVSNLYQKLSKTSALYDTLGDPNSLFKNEDGTGIVDMVFNRSRNLFSGLTSNKDLLSINNVRLKPGVRVHLRAGYSSNPNALQTLFNGTITMVEDGEMVTITAQSDAIELSAFVNSTNTKGHCLPPNIPIQLADGTSRKIGDIVRSKYDEYVVGVDSDGNVVPAKVLNWFKNGTQNDWLDIKLSDYTNNGRKRQIRITEKHNAILNGAFKPMSNAIIGDNMTVIKNGLSDSVIHYIKSSLLGDGSVCKHVSKSEKASKTRSRIYYSESHSQKYDQLNEFVSHCLGTACSSSVEKTSGKGSAMRQSSVSSHYDELVDIYQDWYPNGKKVIPQDLSWVDDFTIAKWYMDDGCMHTGNKNPYVTLATNSFSHEDTQRLALLLKEMYGVDAVASKHTSGYIIRINYCNGTLNAFFKAVAPHIITQMRYKLPEQYHGIGYQEYEYGSIISKLFESKIVSISKVLIPDNSFDRKKTFPHGRVGYDIQTSTGNYFANGVLVHNSGKIDGGAFTNLWLSEPRDLMVTLLTEGSSNFKDFAALATRGTIFSQNKYGIRHFGNILYEPLSDSEAEKHKATTDKIASQMENFGKNIETQDNGTVDSGKAVGFAAWAPIAAFNNRGMIGQVWSNLFKQRDYEIFKRNIYPGNGMGVAQYLGGDLLDGGEMLARAKQGVGQAPNAGSAKTPEEGGPAQNDGVVTPSAGAIESADAKAEDTGSRKKVTNLDDKFYKDKQGDDQTLWDWAWKTTGDILTPDWDALGIDIPFDAIGTFTNPIQAGFTGAYGVYKLRKSPIFQALGLVGEVPDDDLKGFEEVSFRAQTYMKTVWDLFKVCANLLPNYIVAVRPFEDRSTVFYGKPHWMYTSGVIPLTTGIPKSVELDLVEASKDNAKLMRDASDEARLANQMKDQYSKLQEMQQGLSKDQSTMFDSLGSGTAGSGTESNPSIIGPNTVTSGQLVKWFGKHSPMPATPKEIADQYISVGAAEGVRGDLAFVQACLESGYFTSDQARLKYNFAGIAAYDKSPGSAHKYDSIREGVIAHIQLLKKGALGNDTKLALPDGSATWGGHPLTDLFQLSGASGNGSWATDTKYHISLGGLWVSMLKSANKTLNNEGPSTTAVDATGTTPPSEQDQLTTEEFAELGPLDIDKNTSTNIKEIIDYQEATKAYIQSKIDEAKRGDYIERVRAVLALDYERGWYDQDFPVWFKQKTWLYVTPEGDVVDEDEYNSRGNIPKGYVPVKVRLYPESEPHKASTKDGYNRQVKNETDDSYPYISDLATRKKIRNISRESNTGHIARVLWDEDYSKTFTPDKKPFPTLGDPSLPADAGRTMDAANGIWKDLKRWAFFENRTLFSNYINKRMAAYDFSRGAKEAGKPVDEFAGFKTDKWTADPDNKGGIREWVEDRWDNVVGISKESFSIILNPVDLFQDVWEGLNPDEKSKILDKQWNHYRNWLSAWSEDEKAANKKLANIPGLSDYYEEYTKLINYFIKFLWNKPYARAWVIVTADRNIDNVPFWEASKFTFSDDEGFEWNFGRVAELWSDVYTDEYTNTTDQLVHLNEDGLLYSSGILGWMEEHNQPGNEASSTIEKVAQDGAELAGAALQAAAMGIAGAINLFRTQLMQLGAGLGMVGNMQRASNMLNAIFNDSIYYAAGQPGSLLRMADNPFTREYGEPVAEIREPFQRIHYLDSFSDILSNTIMETVDNVYTKVTAVSNGEYPVTVHFDKGMPSNFQFETTIETGIYWDNPGGKGLFAALHPLLHPIETARGIVKGATGYSDEMLARRIGLANLKEFLKDIYSGELWVIGNPDIRPHDLVYMADVYTRTYGLFEVEAVTHHFAPGMGFVTAITPNAVVTVNDPARWGMLAWVRGRYGMQNLRNDARRYIQSVGSEINTLSTQNTIEVDDLYNALKIQTEGQIQYTQGSSALIKDMASLDHMGQMEYAQSAIRKENSLSKGETISDIANTFTLGFASQAWDWIKENLLDQQGCYIQYLTKDGKAMDGGLSYAQGVAVGRNHTKTLLPGILGVKVNTVVDGHVRITTDDLMSALGWSEIDVLNLRRETSLWVSKVNSEVTKLAGTSPDEVAFTAPEVHLAVVQDVKDGDTIRIRAYGDDPWGDGDSGEGRDIRFAGVAAPELFYKDRLGSRGEDPDPDFNEVLLNSIENRARIVTEFLHRELLEIPQEQGRPPVVAVRLNRNNMKDDYERTIGVIFNRPSPGTAFSDIPSNLKKLAEKHPIIPWDSYMPDGTPYTANWLVISSGLAETDFSSLRIDPNY